MCYDNERLLLEENMKCVNLDDCGSRRYTEHEYDTPYAAITLKNTVGR